MVIALLLARFIVGSTFLLAGVAKLVHRKTSRDSLIEFGMPVSLASAATVLLISLEVAISLLMVSPRYAWYGGVLASVLLLLFSGAIGLSMARGRRPACHCFGQLKARAIGSSTLLRNVGLLTAATLLLARGRTHGSMDSGPWTAFFALDRVINVSGTIIVAGLLSGTIWLLLQVLSQQGRLLLRLDALETAVSRAAESQHWRKENEPPRIGHDSVEYPSVGSVAPAFSLPDVEGETVTLEGLLGRGRPIVLAFTDPACGPCSELWPDVARWQREQEDGATFVVVSRGTVDSNRTRMVGHALTDVLLQVDFEVASSYGVLGTPSAVLVHPDGKIGGPVAGGLEAIRNLVRDALGYTYRVRDATESQGITGSVDGMVLTDLSGRLVRLSEEIRQETLLVFWHPKCHYCGAMLEDLRQWEKGRSARHPRVIIISGGTLEENSGIELESLVLLDENFSVGRALGARGTPSAVVVDATGKAVSAVGTGAVGVWSLAGVVREGIEAVRV